MGQGICLRKNLSELNLSSSNWAPRLSHSRSSSGVRTQSGINLMSKGTMSGVNAMIMIDW